MTQQEHIRANKLVDLIKIEKDSINRWEAFMEFNDTLIAKCDYGSNFDRVPSKFIPADIVKIICIQKHTARLKELQDEYDSL